MPNTPDPNANRFIALCDALGQSHDAPAGRRADLEREILRHLPGLAKDRPVLRAGIVILPGLKSGASFSFTGDCGRHGPAVLCRLQRRSRVAAADAVPRRP